MSHTPTPWRSTKNETESPEYERIIIETQQTVIAEVCHAGMEWEEYEANAELIVLAVNSHQAMKEALEEIAKGEGPYSRDPLEHASNTIEAMIELARNALTLANGEDKEP